jgi:hypothetical protein
VAVKAESVSKWKSFGVWDALVLDIKWGRHPPDRVIREAREIGGNCPPELEDYVRKRETGEWKLSRGAPKKRVFETECLQVYIIGSIDFYRDLGLTRAAAMERVRVDLAEPRDDGAKRESFSISKIEDVYRARNGWERSRKK